MRVVRIRDHARGAFPPRTVRLRSLHAPAVSESYDPSAIGARGHRRSSRALAAHLEVCEPPPDGVTVICVVADDRPGRLRASPRRLSSTRWISSRRRRTRACRPRGWRGSRLSVAPACRWGRAAALRMECDESRTYCRALVTGELSIDAEVTRRASGAVGRPSRRGLRSSDTGKGELVMTIEASDGPGLLLAITRSLFRAGVQIVATEAATEDGRVIDRFTIVELDGSPVGEKRRRALQTDLLAAIDAVARSWVARARAPASRRAAARPAPSRGRGRGRWPARPARWSTSFVACPIASSARRTSSGSAVRLEHQHVRRILLVKARRAHRVRGVHPEVDRVRQLLRRPP